MSIKISNRAVEMPESPIRKLAPYAEAAEKKGIHVYHLNIGQPDIPTPRPMLNAVKNFDLDILAYGPSNGFESYRQGLTHYYKKFGVDIDASEIMITAGGSEALTFAFMTCFDYGEEVIIPEPFYANYSAFACAAGVKVVPITSDIATGFALPPIEAIEKLITPKTKGIVICNPNNPTGYLYSQKEMESLAKIIKKHHLFLFCDEAYREFCYTGEHYSCLRLEGVNENVVLFDTISKRYSACGARIGALVTRNHSLLGAFMKFAQSRLCPPTLEQYLAEAGLKLPDNYFDAIKAEYLHRRDTLIGGLNKIPGVVCPNPGGAFYAMAQLPVEDTDDFCRWILEKFQYNNSTIMMAPGAGFYATPGLGKKEVRLAYVLNAADISRALECLGEGLKIYNK